jgi:PAS domain S-box-containing protein
VNIYKSLFRDRSFSNHENQDLSRCILNIVHESLPCLFWISDLTKGRVYYNHLWKKITGAENEEGIGDKWQKFVHPDDRDRFIRLYNEAFDSRTSYSLEYRLCSKNGSLRWMDACGAPYLNSQGDFIGFYGFCIDITSKKERDEELEKSYKNTENALRSKNSLLAAITHEVKLPLTSIAGLSENIMKDEESSQEVKDFAHNVFNNSLAIISTFNNIIDLSKIESGMLDIHKTKLSPEEVITDVLNMAQLNLGQKNISVTTKREGIVPAIIYTDGIRLRQILLNILDEVSVDAQDGYITLIVNGDIQKNKLEFIVEGVRKTIPAGDNNHPKDACSIISGITLTLVKKIIAALDGTMHIHYLEDGTPSITIEIPCKEFDTSLHQPRTHVQVSTSIPTSLFEGDVLLAEDDNASQQFLTLILEKLGLNVFIASNGLEALDIASYKNFDLIFLDMNMPKLNGLGVVQGIRRKEIHVPVVVISVKNSKEEIEIFLNAGCNEFLPKPFPRQELLNILKRHLNLKTSHQKNEPGFTLPNEPIQKNTDQYSLLVNAYINSLFQNIELLNQAYLNYEWEKLIDISNKLSLASHYGLPKIAHLSKLLLTKVVTRNEKDISIIIDKVKDEAAKISQKRSSL